LESTIKYGRESLYPEKKKNNDQDQANTANISDGFHSIDVITIASDSSHEDWVMDLRCYDTKKGLVV
ncbi:hypothetical protein PanWU01x14_304390, partial [Parasponia andersonii]